MSPAEPSCSVVIPTRGRPRALAACLEALAALDYPHDQLEVIVVADGDEHRLEGIVNRMRGRLPLTLIRQDRLGPAAARNTGAMRAQGELIAFTDDDCLPTHGWLRSLAQRYALDPDRAYGGRTVNALTDNPYATASQLVITVGYAHVNRDPEDARFFASNNLAFPREDLLAIGGFDTSFCTSEDRDLCARWRHSGRRMSYVPEAVVVHASDLNLGRFWRQFFAYGRGAARFRRRELQRAGSRVPIEPSYYLAIIRHPFLDPSVERRVFVAMLLLLWHLANTAGFLREQIRARRAGTARA
jgi:GT2 family glycosyltransferase